jgi:hypothetical protein
MIPDKVIIDKEKITAIAEALRVKLNSSDTFTADEIAQELENYTLDATATSDSIRVGYSAYSKNEKIDGTIESYDGSYIENTNTEG